MEKYDGYYKYDSDVAKTYESSRESEKHWKQENEFVKNYLKNNNVKYLLDIPIGTGRFFPYYQSVNRITGVDISEDMLEEAKRTMKFGGFSSSMSVHLEIGDIFNFRFDDFYFDVAMVFRLMHLIPAPLLSSAIKELCRVVNKQVVLQTYDPPNKIEIFKKKLTNFVCHKPVITNIIKDEDQPWSHIKAFYHKKLLVNKEFKKNGFLISHYQHLSDYGGCQVGVTIYSRK